MAQQEIEEAKKPEGDQPDAAKEMLLEQQADPEAQDQAEQSVRSYVGQRLGEFIEEMDNTFDGVEAWVLSQSEDRRASLNQGGYFDFLGARLEQELLNLAGGATPLMSALVGELHNANDFSARSTPNISLFMAGGPRSGLKYGAWYVRDAVDGLLGDKWSEILTLAANGSEQFIPALHLLGIPTLDFNPAELTATLQQASEDYLATVGTQKEEVKEADQAGTDSSKQQELEQASKDEMVEEQSKPKEAMA